MESADQSEITVFQHGVLAAARGAETASMTKRARAAAPAATGVIRMRVTLPAGTWKKRRGLQNRVKNWLRGGVDLEPLSGGRSDAPAATRVAPRRCLRPRGRAAPTTPTDRRRRS